MFPYPTSFPTPAIMTLISALRNQQRVDVPKLAHALWWLTGYGLYVALGDPFANVQVVTGEDKPLPEHLLQDLAKVVEDAEKLQHQPNVVGVVTPVAILSLIIGATSLLVNILKYLKEKENNNNPPNVVK
jgi:hypothetical protein